MSFLVPSAIQKLLGNTGIKVEDNYPDFPSLCAVVKKKSEGLEDLDIEDLWLAFNKIMCAWVEQYPEWYKALNPLLKLRELLIKEFAVSNDQEDDPVAQGAIQAQIDRLRDIPEDVLADPKKYANNLKAIADAAGLSEEDDEDDDEKEEEKDHVRAKRAAAKVIHDLVLEGNEALLISRIEQSTSAKKPAKSIRPGATFSAVLPTEVSIEPASDRPQPSQTEAQQLKEDFKHFHTELSKIIKRVGMVGFVESVTKGWLGWGGGKSNTQVPLDQDMQRYLHALLTGLQQGFLQPVTESLASITARETRINQTLHPDVKKNIEGLQNYVGSLASDQESAQAKNSGTSGPLGRSALAKMVGMHSTSAAGNCSTRVQKPSAESKARGARRGALTAELGAVLQQRQRRTPKKSSQPSVKVGGGRGPSAESKAVNAELAAILKRRRQAFKQSGEKQPGKAVPTDHTETPSTTPISGR